MTNGKVPQDIRRKAMELRREQQKMAQLGKQKEQLQGELTGTENALKAVEKSKEDEDVHKVVGNVMIEKDKEDLKQELREKKENLSSKVEMVEQRFNDMKEGIEDRREKLNKQVQDSGLR